MPPDDLKCVMIIAGEASGDQHGARVVAALRERFPNLSFTGIGGSAMQSAGVRILLDAHSLAVVGITEIFAKAKNLFKGISTAKKHLRSLRPDLLILIDFPDFNLHVAATAKKIGVPVLYYISPQIWAWRAGRAKKIRRRVDHMAVILPFEVDFYDQYQVPATFVGHPLLDTVSKPSGESTGQLEPPQSVIALLPGSRDKEVLRLLPEMLKAAKILKRKIPDALFLLSLAPSVKRELVENLISVYGQGVNCTIETEGVHRVFSRSTLAVAASGTVTLEAAIVGIPTVIIYKLSPVSYWMGRLLIRVNHIGLANLIAGREIVPELIQKDVTPTKIADTVYRMIGNTVELNESRSALLALRNQLGGPGAARRVADIAARMLGEENLPMKGSRPHHGKDTDKIDRLDDNDRSV